METLSVEKFYFIHILSDETIEKGVILQGLKKDIEMLGKITSILGKFLNRINKYEILSEEDAKKYHMERINFQIQHSEEFNAFNEIMRNNMHKNGGK